MAKMWRIIPRPLLETVLNNHAVAHHRVAQPLFLHGPRGVGKSTLLHHRLLPFWSTSPHFTAFVDFSFSQSPTWTSSSSSSPLLPTLTSRLESSLEAVVHHGVRLGTIGASDVFAALTRRHAVRNALRRIVGGKDGEKVATSVLWARALARRIGGVEVEDRSTMEEVAYMREAAAAIRLAKEVVVMHREWRTEAVRRLNGSGRFSRPLADSCTDWPCLLIELLSGAAEMNHFQPKLVINNIEILRKAVNTDDSMVSASLYHDSFLWRLVALGVNQWCLPVIIVTSDSYYSYQAYVDFGCYPDIFISRETFGWTQQEAKMHMVPEFFSESEWKLIDKVIGTNQRHLNEIYMLKQGSDYKQTIQCTSVCFEDTVDAYLAYLQVDVVNPAMESALCILQKFVSDVKDGKIPESRLCFGAPWRHPPTDHALSLSWARVQLMDFVQSLVNAEFGVNYLADDTEEIFDDPCTNAMVEVGLLYIQRDPSFIRPISRGVLRCLTRWLVHQRVQMSFLETVPYFWQRLIRGRSYRHLMKEIGYK